MRVGVLALLLLVLMLLALIQGSYPVTLRELLQVFTGGADEAATNVVWHIRLPRVISAVVSGWGLALAGVCTQTVLKNPLGAPSTLGISQGAGFGAALCIVFGASGFFSVSLAAFLGAMLVTATILLLARMRGLSPEAVILAGVAISALVHSGTVLVQYLASEIQLSEVIFWTFGDVSRSGWQEILWMTPVVGMITLVMFLLRWKLNALAAGDETAVSLGVNAAVLRLMVMFLAALLAAVITAGQGVIGFVGLVAPHMARRVIGEDHRMLLLLSSLCGAILLLAADLAGRVLIGSGALPVGVVTSFLGAPLFLYLLTRSQR